MPNALAYLMLMIWPAVAWALFRRLGPERAIIWTILGGYLILPQGTEFDLPLVPALDKVTIPNLCAFLLCVFYLKKPVALWPQSWGMRLILLTFVGGVIATVMTNDDAIVFTLLGETAPIVFSTAALPGLGLRDLASVLINQVLILLPFLLARQFLSTPDGMRELLLALVLGGLVYTIPALIEIRLSPQMHIWVYGFFQHEFGQMIRGDGFRPIVFLPHALWMAFFMMSAAMAAIALWREDLRRDRIRWLIFAAWLLIVLFLCKSLASMLYAMALGPVIFVTSARTQIRLAFVFALIAVIYPMLRNNGWIPLEAILAQAEAISPDRAQSLGFRFDNEEALLARAHKKPWFGWGGWGRNLVHDLQTGRIESIPDGEWIIVFGTFGWVGYVSQMGLLAGPLILLWWSLRRRQPVAPYVAPVALLLAITMMDMLLNAILTPYTWLMAGAVLGHCEMASGRDTAKAAPAGPVRPRTVMGQAAPTVRRTRL